MNLELVILQGRPLGKTLVFPRGEYFLGRGLECHVRFDCEWVSRQHCLLRVDGPGAFLRDLGSRNGTVVNGSLLSEEALLREGDQVQLGPVLFGVRFAETGMPSGMLAVGPGEAPTQDPAQDPTLSRRFIGEIKKDPAADSTAPPPEV